MKKLLLLSLLTGWCLQGFSQEFLSRLMTGTFKGKVASVRTISLKTYTDSITHKLRTDTVQKITQRFNRDGFITDEVTDMRNAGTDTVINYRYKYQGSKLTELTARSDNSELLYTSVYVYRGDTVEQVQYLFPKKSFTQKGLFINGPNNLLAEYDEYRRGKLYFKAYYKYDQFGRRISKTGRDSTGKISFTLTYKYNTAGNMLSENYVATNEPSYIETFTYPLSDKAGNWLVQKSDYKKKMYTAIRKIAYYTQK